MRKVFGQEHTTAETPRGRDDQSIPPGERVPVVQLPGTLTDLEINGYGPPATQVPNELTSFFSLCCCLPLLAAPIQALPDADLASCP